MRPEAVVDVDVDKGGDLGTNDDRIDPFSRIGSNALVETEKLLMKLQADQRIETTAHVQSEVIVLISEGQHIAI